MTTTRGGKSSGLQKAQRKTKVVATEVQRASDHASVIGAVLANELPEAVQVGDVAQAIEQTEDLEHRLAESAQTLTEVTAELGREVKKRRIVTKRLTKSRAKVNKLSGAGKRKP